MGLTPTFAKVTEEKLEEGGGGGFLSPPPPPILNRVKTKPVGVNSSIYFDFNKWNNKEGPIFKVGDHVKISKHQNIFAKGNVPNCSEEVFVIKKFKKDCPVNIC